MKSRAGELERRRQRQSVYWTEGSKKNKREEDRLQKQMTGESKGLVEDRGTKAHSGQSQEQSYQS